MAKFVLQLVERVNGRVMALSSQGAVVSLDRGKAARFVDQDVALAELERLCSRQFWLRRDAFCVAREATVDEWIVRVVCSRAVAEQFPQTQHRLFSLSGDLRIVPFGSADVGIFRTAGAASMALEEWRADYAPRGCSASVLSRAEMDTLSRQRSWGHSDDLLERLHGSGIR